jgi:hypothetical protein
MLAGLRCVHILKKGVLAVICDPPAETSMPLSANA